MACTATAQDWKDALTKIATEAADKATDGKLTQYALVGTWNYTAPGIKLEGEDTTSSLLGTALESSITTRLEKIYTYAGIKPGACTFTFDNEHKFSAVMGTHKLSGTYEFDAATHVITLQFSKNTYKLGTMNGHAYISGTNLQLVFPITKLVNLMTALGSKISSFSTITTMLKKYENVYIGFAFSK